MPRDQRRSGEREAASKAGHVEHNRDNAEARGTASSMQREVGVTQRVPEAVQCLRGLTQRVLGLSQRLEGLMQNFKVAGEGFVGQVF